MATRQTKRAVTAEAKAPPARRKPRKETPSAAGRKKSALATKPPATKTVAMAAADPQVAAAPKGKLGDLLAALKQKGGTGLTEVSEALGWQPHTTRAAITRLRQRGFDIVLEGDRGARCYRLQSEA